MVLVRVLVFQIIKVVVDWLISSNSRAVHKILTTNADLLLRLRLCNAFVQHILSKVYWWDNIHMHTYIECV